MSDGDKEKSKDVREYRPDLPAEYRDSKRLVFIFSFLLFTITSSGQMYDFKFGSFLSFDPSKLSPLYIEGSVAIAISYIIIHMHFQLKNALKVWRLKNYDMSNIEMAISRLSDLTGHEVGRNRQISEEKLALFANKIDEILENCINARDFIINKKDISRFEVGSAIGDLEKLRNSWPDVDLELIGTGYLDIMNRSVGLIRHICSMADQAPPQFDGIYSEIAEIKSVFIVYKNIDYVLSELKILILRFNSLILNIQEDIENEVYWFEFKIPFMVASSSCLYWLTTLEHSYCLTR